MFIYITINYHNACPDESFFSIPGYKTFLDIFKETLHWDKKLYFIS